MYRILRLSAPWLLGCLALQLALLSLLSVPQQARADEPSDECAVFFGYGTADYYNCITAYDEGCSQCMYFSGADWTNCMNNCAADPECKNNLAGTNCDDPGKPCTIQMKAGTCSWSMNKSNCECVVPP